MKTWVVVLIKDFDEAKQRLRPALGTKSRRRLARRNALLAVQAAAAGDHVLVVAGGEEVAEMAAAWGAEDVLLEPREEGQNVAAERGLERAVEAGAGAVLLLSSDLPLVTHEAVRVMLESASRLKPPVAVAVPAIGRGGTNALYLRPPKAIGMFFGDDSLAKFREDAEAKHVRFVLHHSDALALDLDEPSDLARLSRAV